ncbi:MAG: diguanylate cyclase [Bacillota bacterium]|nr:diguanylate cyclase [Bacillota bacterium]
MERLIDDYYVILSLLLACIDIFICIGAFSHKGELGKYIGLVSVFAIIVDISYMFSIYVTDYFTASYCASIYFAGIDWTFILLIKAMLVYAGAANNSLIQKIKRGFILYGVFDTVVLLINPFKEIAISYIPTGFSFVHYVYEIHALYIMHLVYTYILIALIIASLVYYSVKSPVVYRARYTMIVVTILVLVAVNAVFLYIPGDSSWKIIDYSIIGYSFVLYIIYYSCFKYSRNVIHRNISMDIFNKIDQGIVFFDYRQMLTMKNQKAEAVLDSIDFNDGDGIDKFISALDIADIAKDESGSLQCSTCCGEEMTIRRCDYRVLRDKKNRVSGTLFVFTDMEEEIDILTGFQYQKYFERFINENPDIYNCPAVIASFDINSLSVINATEGREEGDRMIKELAELMRKHLPSDTCFVRGNEAILIAVCPLFTNDAVNAAVDNIAEEYSGYFQWSSCMLDGKNNDLLKAVDDAVHGMQNRKLLDKGSVSSNAISSLVKALKESDADTADHVKRTQYYGNALGCRIGLSDVQQSQLLLLCLMHDIGKIGIPLEILNKPGKLTVEEWNVIKTHVEKGYDIARSSQSLKDIAGMILHHHERWDGKGYPAGLSRESIPLLSRMIAVVDAFDAMTNDRPYREGTSVQAALSELKRNAGTQFDPYLVSEFIQLVNNGDIVVNEKHNRNEVLEVFTESTEDLEIKNEDRGVFEIDYSRYILDSEERILEIDEKFTEMTGYTQEDIEAGMKQSDLIPEDERAEYILTTSKLLAQNQFAYLEHAICCKDGRIIYVICYGRRYYDSAAKVNKAEIFIADVLETYSIRKYVEAQRIKAEQRLSHWEMTYRTDSLTGLMSHAPFRNDVELHLLKRKQQVMLIMMDVDEFKKYNDTYGHSAGDEFLVFLANTLKSALRASDLACRMGGDEFAAAIFFDEDALAELMENRASEIFRKINAATAARKISTGVSMGVAISDDTLSSFNDLYLAADNALYLSKGKESNRFTVFR